MPGLVFTEFVEPVENKFSPGTADAAAPEVAPPSRHTGVPADALVQTFRGHLLQRVAAGPGDRFARHARWRACDIRHPACGGPAGAGVVVTLDKRVP